MRTYQLYRRKENAWDWVGTLDAPTHADAFRAALLCLAPGDERRPIRIEQDTEGAYRKPCKPRSRSAASAPCTSPEYRA
ncbi:MAG TPA: hypothetical protein VGI81_11405 [Tepidisphaeraceae bacterium]